MGGWIDRWMAYSRRQAGRQSVSHSVKSACQSLRQSVCQSVCQSFLEIGPFKAAVRLSHLSPWKSVCPFMLWSFIVSKSWCDGKLKVIVLWFHPHWLHTYLDPNVKIIFCNSTWPFQSQRRTFRHRTLHREHISWLHDAQHCILHPSLTLGVHWFLWTHSEGTWEMTIKQERMSEHTGQVRARIQCCTSCNKDIWPWGCWLIQ